MRKEKQSKKSCSSGQESFSRPLGGALYYWLIEFIFIKCCVSHPCHQPSCHSVQKQVLSLITTSFACLSGCTHPPPPHLGCCFCILHSHHTDISICVLIILTLLLLLLWLGFFCCLHDFFFFIIILAAIMLVWHEMNMSFNNKGFIKVHLIL